MGSYTILKRKYAGLPLVTWIGLLLALMAGIAGITDRKTVEQTNRQYLNSLIKSNTIENTASAVVVTKRKNWDNADRKNVDWVEMANRLRKCMVEEAKKYSGSDDQYLDQYTDRNTPRLLAAKLMRSCDAIE